MKLSFAEQVRVWWPLLLFSLPLPSPLPPNHSYLCRLWCVNFLFQSHHLGVFGYGQQDLTDGLKRSYCHSCPPQVRPLLHNLTSILVISLFALSALSLGCTNFAKNWWREWKRQRIGLYGYVPDGHISSPQGLFFFFFWKKPVCVPSINQSIKQSINQTNKQSIKQTNKLKKSFTFSFLPLWCVHFFVFHYYLILLVLLLLFFFFH